MVNEARIKKLLAILIILPTIYLSRHRIISLIKISYITISKAALGLAIWANAVHFEMSTETSPLYKFV